MRATQVFSLYWKKTIAAIMKGTNKIRRHQRLMPAMIMIISAKAVRINTATPNARRLRLSFGPIFFIMLSESNTAEIYALNDSFQTKHIREPNQKQLQKKTGAIPAGSPRHSGKEVAIRNCYKLCASSKSTDPMLTSTSKSRWPFF